MAGPQRKLEFVISGDADKAVAALRQLAAAGKNTGGELGKAATQLKKALGQQLTTVEPAGKQKGAQSGKAFGDSFADAAREALGSRIEDLLPGNFAGGLLNQMGGTDVLLGKLSGTTAVAAAGAATAAAAFTAFASSSVKAFNETGAAVAQFQRQTGASVEVSSQMVAAAKSLGVDFDTLSGSVKDFGENISDRYLDLQKFGFEVARTSDGTVDFVGSMLNAIDVFNGLRDPIDQAAFASQAFGGEWEKMLPIIKAGRAELEKRFGAAPVFTDDDLKRQRDYAQATRDLSATIGELKLELGRDLIPFLTDVAKGFTGAINGARELKTTIETLGGTQNPDKGFWSDFIKGWKNTNAITATWPKELADKQRELASATTISADAAEQHAMAAQGQTYWLDLLQQSASGAKREVIDIGNAALSTADKLAAASSAFIAFTAVERAGISSSVNLMDAYGQLDSLMAASTDTSGKAAEAASNLAAAQSDAAESVAEARKDAAERIAEVEERSAERIVDAQKRVDEARKRSARSLEDANERVQQALSDLVDAAVQSADDENPFKAAKRIEEARKRVADAEKDLAQTREDTAADVQDAEQELAKTTAEAAKDRAKAQADAADRIAKAEQSAARSVASAQKSMQDAYKSTAQSTGTYTGALQGVVDKTFDAAYWTRINGGSLEDVQKIVDVSEQKVRNFAQAMGLSAQQTELLVSQLKLIPSKVEIEYVLKMNATEFLRAMQAAAKNFQDPATKAMFESGIIEVVGGTQAVPRFAEGGMFRTFGAPGGAGLAVLHDGERVVPADQASAGGGTTIIVQGSVITERELGDILERQARRGFAGVR